MTFLFISIATVVGVLCGALMGYETRNLGGQPKGWLPWVLLSGVGALVVTGALLVERINETNDISALVKAFSILAALIGFVVALFMIRKVGRKPSGTEDSGKFRLRVMGTAKVQDRDDRGPLTPR